MEKSVLRNFTNFTGEHLRQSLFFNKAAGLRPATLFKKRLWHSCFLLNFAKFLGTPFHRTPLDDCFSTCFFLLILVITFSNMFKSLFTVLPKKNSFISKSLKNNRRTEKSIPRKCQKFQFNNLFCPRPSSFLKNVFLIGVSSWDHSLSLI